MRVIRLALLVAVVGSAAGGAGSGAPQHRVFGLPVGGGHSHTTAAVDVEELLVRAWARRADTSFLPELGRQLTRLLQAEVLDEHVEFWLPQIAHLIVALPAASPAAGLLERFALLVCERNVHVALTLSWMIYASLEDHAPDRPGADAGIYARCARLLAHIEQSAVYGARLRYTTRREALREQIGRAARAIAGHAAAAAAAAAAATGGGHGNAHALGRPSDFPPSSASASRALQRLPLPAAPAAAAASSGADGGSGGEKSASSGRAPSRSGVLWLIVGKPSAFYLSSLLGLTRHGYRRHLVWLSESSLFFRAASWPLAADPKAGAQVGGAEGAIPLAHARIELRTSSRGYTYLYVGARYSKRELRLRPAVGGAEGSAQLQAWREALLRAAGRGEHDDEAALQPVRPARGCRLWRWLGARLGRLRARRRERAAARRRLAAGGAGGSGAHPKGQPPAHRGSSELRALSPAQRKTYEFLLAQRDLVHSLCSLAEELFVAAEPTQQLAERLAGLQLPPVCYLPICKSNDVFERIVRIPPAEAVVFVTQARSSIMLFVEVLRSKSGRTVARLFAPAASAASTRAAPLAPPEEEEEEEGEEGEAGSERRARRRRAGLRAARRAGSLARRLLLLPARAVGAVCRAPLSLARLLGRGLRPRAGMARSSAGGSAQPAAALAQAVAAVGGHKLDESWEAKARRMRAASPRGSSRRWLLRSVLCKANDDVRQEAFVMQLLRVLHEAFPPPLRLRPYAVLPTGRACGLIETVVGARSLDHAKKRAPADAASLPAMFEARWGSDPARLASARTAFLHSLAAYAIATYLLAIRDRHNGNVLLADDGSLVHIDFGFALGLAPGGRFGPETSAPFKLTAEMVDVLGGPDSHLFRDEFPRLCTLALRAARTRARTLLTLVEVMALRPSLKCFVGAGCEPIDGLRARLMLDVPDDELPARVQQLIERSYKAVGPSAYDRYQRLRNGIRA